MLFSRDFRWNLPLLAQAVVVLRTVSTYIFEFRTMSRINWDDWGQPDLEKAKELLIEAVRDYANRLASPGWPNPDLWRATPIPDLVARYNGFAKSFAVCIAVENVERMVAHMEADRKSAYPRRYDPYEFNVKQLAQNVVILSKRQT